MPEVNVAKQVCSTHPKKVARSQAREPTPLCGKVIAHDLVSKRSDVFEVLDAPVFERHVLSESDHAAVDQLIVFSVGCLQLKRGRREAAELFQQPLQVRNGVEKCRFAHAG